MSTLEAQRSTTLSSLSLNGLLGHDYGRNRTKLYLRELMSLRRPRRRQRPEIMDPARPLALCQEGQLRDSPTVTEDARSVEGSVVPCVCRASTALEPCLPTVLCPRAFLLADLSILLPSFHLMYPKPLQPGTAGYVSASVLAGRN